MRARPSTFVLLISLLLAAPARAERGPDVIGFPSLGSARRVVIAGRVLQEAPTQGSSVLSRNLRRLLASTWRDAPVKVRYAGVERKVFSGKDGEFEATFVAPEAAPFPSGVSEAQIEVPGLTVKVPVEVVDPGAPFIVVSDFDDTLAVTHVLSRRGLASSALLKDAEDHPVVPGMAGWYQCLAERSDPRPSFALVSGSPVQYVPRTQAFLKRHGFPPFGMYLRNLGLDTLSGYKEPKLRALLSELPHPVILVGDSGERDPEIYAAIAAEFPGRVLRIYIRNAGRVEEKGRFENMLLFDHAEEAARDAVERGYASAECVARRVSEAKP